MTTMRMENKMSKSIVGSVTFGSLKSIVIDNKCDILPLDMTPDAQLPIRVLQAYLD